MKILVTEEDIKNGKKGSGYSCPIVLAISRIFPGQTVEVWLKNDHQWIVIVGKKIQFDLHRDYAKKAEFFDKTGKMEPFVMHIKIPSLETSGD